MCFLSGCFGPIFNETTALVHLFCCHWSWRQVPHWRNPLLVDSILDFIKVACSLKPFLINIVRIINPFVAITNQHLCWRKSKVSNQSTKSAASFTNYTSAPKQRLQLAEIQVCKIFNFNFLLKILQCCQQEFVKPYFLSWGQWQGRKTGARRGRVIRRGKRGNGRKFRGQV